MAGFGISPMAASDEEAIRSVVRSYGAAWNNHDISAMAELFADDAHWVSIVGWHWPGKTAVVAGHEALHRTFYQKTDIKIADIENRLIAPDVGISIIHLKVEPFTPSEGVSLGSGETRLSLVLTRRDGRWRIVHGHSTVINPAASPYNPAKIG